VLREIFYPVTNKIAFENFAEQHGVEILCLPTGQRLIIKPWPETRNKYKLRTWQILGCP
jgi:hypothetical protein